MTDLAEFVVVDVPSHPAAGVIPDDTGEWVKAITYLPAVKERGVDAALHVLIEDAG